MINKLPLEAYNKGNNFWEVNPTYRVVEVFEGLYKADKSNKKKKSSNVMWALAFCLRRESPLYNMPEKWNLVITDIIKDNKFKWESNEELIHTFKNTCLTQSERGLLSWEEMMFKRDKYLKNIDYYFDQYATDENGDNVLSKTGSLIIERGTATQLDKAFSVTPKMYADFDKIRRQIEEDDIKRGKGNKPKSLSDADEM